MTVAETPWDDESRNWALALDEHEADICPGCGGQLSETLKVPGQPFAKWDVYTFTCSRCEATDAIQHESHKVHEANAKDNPNYRPPGGRHWAARRVFPDWTPKADD